MKTSFYFRIIGFIFRFDFYKTEWNVFNKLLIKDICVFLAPFAMHKTATPYDCRIMFTLESSPKYMFINKKETTYISLYKRINSNIIECYYKISIPQLQYMLVSILQNLLHKNNGFFLHASSVLINDKAHMFMGSSGAGKSTIASFLKTKYPLLSDDIMILKKEGLEYIVYQFPFPEKQNDINKTPNKKFKIGGVYLLHKAQMCRLDKIQSLKEINQGFEDAIFNDINQRYKRDLIRLISTHNNFYHLYFRNDKKTTLGLFTNGERIEN